MSDLSDLKVENTPEVFRKMNIFIQSIKTEIEKIKKDDGTIVNANNYNSELVSTDFLKIGIEYRKVMIEYAKKCNDSDYIQMSDVCRRNLHNHLLAFFNAINRMSGYKFFSEEYVSEFEKEINKITNDKREKVTNTILELLADLQIYPDELINQIESPIKEIIIEYKEKLQSQCRENDIKNPPRKYGGSDIEFGVDDAHK